MLLGLLLAAFCRTGSAQFAQPIEPAEAATKVNEEVQLTMKGNSANLRNGNCFLNSEQDFKNVKNFTVFIGRDVLVKFKQLMIDDPAAHFRGKNVLVRGKVTLFRERPQIALTGPEAITIVDEQSQ